MILGKDIKNYILKFYQELLFLDVLNEISFKRKRDRYYIFNHLDTIYTYLYEPKENGFQAQNIYLHLLI